MYAIETNKLTKIYRRQHLGKVYLTCGVQDIDLTINKGEIFGLLGLNGSGKTTTIKLILGLLKPTKGNISVLGKSAPSVEVLKYIGYLPEVPYFYRYLKAKEILKLYGSLSNLDNLDERVENVLEMIGLKNWANKHLSEFSKGMLQRIGIAQSLLHNPEILIYDEPVSGLDPLAVQEMRNLITKLKTQGKTIFLSSHLISEVEKVCDRVGILVKGQLVKIIEQKDWASKGGELENVFVSYVADSRDIGRMKI